ncbi:uncharacterized protein LOC108104917 isoform X2 [Drosophila eugracilis]|uniref:uncharacterized protein LOC108104917 isoform X2 n=1 Tax=Drosophila eugracilis TaxID=29029 RepID=UPI0007E7C5D3|nr:uncharacterized protein LOC108104917 isoform X2 [Drosophila eugracilis]
MWAAKYVLCALTCVAFASASPNSERRKKNIMDIPEEPKVPVYLAPTLDMSCSVAKITPPEINHGKVERYERRRRGKKVFLVAFFNCDLDYEFESENAEMFCSNNKWVGEIPTCIPKSDYLEPEPTDETNYDEDDFEEYETVATDDAENDENDDEENVENLDREPPPPPPPPVKEEVAPKLEPEIVIHINEDEASQVAQAELPKESSGQTFQEETAPKSDVETVEKSGIESDKEIIENEIPLEPEVEIEVSNSKNTSVKSAKDPYEPTLLDNDCGEDNGGCEQICKRLLYPDENQPLKKCDCRQGYTLNLNDYASCLDIDECQESNGGCQEICENLPGKYKCSCQAGYYVDASGKTCVDINECANPELSSDCENGCENLPGSYRCVVPLVEKSDSTEVVESSIDERPPPKITCNPGFELSANGTECLDINECEVKGPEDLKSNGICQQKCENTIGSFRCYCLEGYHLLEDQKSCALDKCLDLENPQLNRTRCAHQCEDLPEGSYQCKCPKGYELAEDRHSCLVQESPCSKDKGIEKCSPGTCLVSEDNTSFSCVCPDGYRSEGFSCQDIDECKEDMHLCSHTCQNTPGGYQCLCPIGLRLVEDYTCLAENLCEVNNNGCEQICLTARGGACSCRDGYRLSADGKSCEDVDECLVKNGGCQQVCRNLPGTHACACERGYELGEDKKTCQDVDECAGLLSGGCTHECINKAGTFECGCPLGYILNEDERSCRPAIVGCPPGTQRSAEGCSPIECSPGFILGSDDKCVDIDECLKNNGGCSNRCLNTEGSYECSCPPGYKLESDQKTCQDIDECAQNKTSCATGKCINELGGFRCEFPKFPTYPEIPSISSLPAPPKKPTYPDFNELSKNIPKKPEYPIKTDFSTTKFPSLPEWPKPELPKLPSFDDLPTTTARSPVKPDFSVSKFPSLPEWPRPEISKLPSFDDFPTTTTTVTPKSPRVNPFRPRDLCPRFQPPSNGRASCGKYRHVQKQFYNIRCRITCNHGYVLQGPDTKICGASGIWEGPETKCVAFSQPRVQSGGLCSALKPVANGVLYPPSCTKGPSGFGDICHIQCNPGFVSSGSLFTTCTVFNSWSFGPDFKCKPFNNGIFGNPLFPTQWKSPQRETTLQTQQVQEVKPYIKCPENVVIFLHRGEEKAHVTLQRPQSNVKGRLLVHPTWANQLQGHLPAGAHQVSFRISDPETKVTIGCHTLITIKPAPAAETNFLDVSSSPRSSLPRPAPFASLYISSPSSYPSFSSLDSVPKPNSFTKFSTKISQSEFPRSRFADTESNPFSKLESFSQESAPFPTFSTHSSLRQSEVPSPSSFDSEPSSFSSFEPLSQKSSKIIDPVPAPAPAPVRQESTRVKLGSDSSNYCPPSIEVYLKENQHLRSVVWEEPRFQGKLLRIYNSHFPGSLFKEGDHTVKYEATTTDGRTLSCTFIIYVKPPKFVPPIIQPEIDFDADINFDGPGTYVVCPNSEPVLVTAEKSVNLPVGCTVKKIHPKSSPPKPVKRGTLTSLWHGYHNF